MSDEPKDAEPQAPQAADQERQEIKDLDVSETESESVLGGGSAGSTGRRTG